MAVPGGLGDRSPPTLRRCCTLAALFVFFLVFLHQTAEVAAKHEADSDLIFNEEPVAQPRTIVKRDTSSAAHTSSSVVSESSHEPSEDHWLHRTVNRVKRYFNSATFSEEDKTEDNEVDGVVKSNDLGEEEDQQTGDYEGEDEENDKYDYGEDSNNRTEQKTDSSPDTDDEDFGANSGNGDEEDEGITTIRNYPGQNENTPSHPVYFRITFALMEPYVDDLADKFSNRYRRLSEEIEDNVDNLYKNINGTQVTKVVTISKRNEDTFSSLITLDLESQGNSNADQLKDIIEKQIMGFHSIGALSVIPQDFQFRHFEGPNAFVCKETEIQCSSGECVPSTSRCNGISECPDDSDESGCINEDLSARTPTTTGTTPEPEPPATTTPTIDIYPESDFQFGRCRGDDVIRCSDGSATFCSEQECDGVRNCENGEDEDNCTKCAIGEWACDLTRCIPESFRCDGKPDCGDETDEHECQDGQCQPRQFRCDNGYCIDQTQRCDGRPDCSGGEDERGCPARPGLVRCSSQEFTCGDGTCVPIESKCDKRYDCHDRSDERNCPCDRDKEFTCENGFCIPWSQRCDKFRHCQDGSDERNCSGINPDGCETHEKRCNDGSCIDQIKICNGQRDCADGSDEMHCCLSDQIRCSNGTCLPLSKKCDGVDDCENAEDEDNCVHCVNQFRCSNGDCLDLSKRCDGNEDCYDGSDEQYCNGTRDLVCVRNAFRCFNNKKCVPEIKVCDGHKDCMDGSDEGKETCDDKVFGYPKNKDAQPVHEAGSGTTCGPNYFQCSDGQCVQAVYRCDQVTDCADRSDEQNCSFDCGPGQHKCNDGSCSNATLCNGVPECRDGSDEADCSVCSPVQFSCTSGGCIPDYQRCDNAFDCSDGSDEVDCVRHCPPDQFRCGDGLCLDIRRKCDSYPDCADKSDEQGCTSEHCGPDKFECTSSRECIELGLQCDGYPDCPDNSDEKNCSTACESDEFDCGDNHCIPENRRCDGTRDCDNGNDEFDCPTVTRQCQSSEFRCNDGACMPQSLYCDGRRDCPDGSDESNCGPTGCTGGDFQCSDGNCIPEYLRCDQRSDCPDGSDESGCPTRAPEVRPGFPRCPPGQQSCRTGNQCGTYCNVVVECQDRSDEENCPIVTEACSHGYFRCENGPCIPETQRCNGRIDCPLDSSDELDCPFRPNYDDYDQFNTNGLNLKTYPNEQEIKESNYKIGREVVFRCRDEGPLRAMVRWSRSDGQYLPPGSADHNGRLEMPNIQLNHTGIYVCSAIGYSASTPGAQVTVHLQVNPYVVPTARPTQPACGLYEATCSNGDCIAKNLVCDGKFDCSDGSDETRCKPFGCEPNEFRCANKRCILKTWRCDSDDDCGDNSDESDCNQSVPGSPCRYDQFACRSGNQCIPRSFHCDQSNDCTDGSDEIGCSPVTIMRPPPPMIHLEIGEIFVVTCTAVGVPTPEINWRLNWGHVPEKCKMTSVNGLGTLTCPDIQEADQGAYSCEGINIRGSVIATPDTILTVGPPTGVCPKGYFNEEARNVNECISCFCFGHTKECQSADLFTYHLQPPFDSHKYYGVKIDPYTGVVDIRDEPIYKGAEPKLRTLPARNGVHATLEAPHGALVQPDVVPYFAMPENYHGNQLKSYGGYLNYKILYYGYGQPTSAPDVILTGNGYNLLHIGKKHQSGREEDMQVRFFVGEWVRRSESEPEKMATREEIMMALASVENILIKMQYVDDRLDTKIEGIEMDSAAIRNTGLGQATYVEQCSCPVGYSGLSCESCAVGYSRHRSGPWLGQCYKEIETCPHGYYGDPSRGISCQTCPCPLTSPPNQFARTCHLDNDGEVTCDCPREYVGRRCETCAQGYTGNPLVPGDYCRPAQYCNSYGTAETTDEGQCQCKVNTAGPTCNTCKPNSFYLGADNQFGCVSCFCMGITDQCSSSSLYRDQITAMFASSKNDFKLVESNNKETQISDGIILDQNAKEIVYSDFRHPDVYYWYLPSRFLGNKLTSYGGYLRYSLRYVPSPGGQSSKNNAHDVELISDNHISLTYFTKDQSPANRIQNFTVPLLEQYWQRSDGQQADREHLMMALADVKAILIKATYTTNTREAALQSVSLDIADERNTGNERALAVEQCKCVNGYKGLSCEDCGAGYTRTIDGIYLGRCEKCECNGHSNECNPETGECVNCRSHTTGPSCEQCQNGYEGDPANNIPCRYIGGPSQPCDCNRDGSISNDCINGRCQCKTNVQGDRCDFCREGTFGLNYTVPEGCLSCFCSGVATECRESNMYIEQIPSQIFDEHSHGFTLVDQNQREVINTNFDLNFAKNEIGYTFRPSNMVRYFWSLPSVFTGPKITSYGGTLEYTQRYTHRGDASYVIDQDVVIIGNGITIYWTNPSTLYPNIANKISVDLSPNSKWQRLDHRSGPKPASREDILKVLANINSILIRAQVSSDTMSSYLSDISLDTAVEHNNGKPRATNVEVCVCSPGYSGTSCELCATGYYRDINDIGTGPLGSCSRCPCSQNEASCQLGPDNRVICNCLPGFTGSTCQFSDSDVTPTPIPVPGPTPEQPTITVSISSPRLTIKEVGGEVRFQCTARSMLNRNVKIQWTRADSDTRLPDRAIDDSRGLLIITNLKVSDSGNYVCTAEDGYTIVTENVNLLVGVNNPTAPRAQIYPEFVQVNEGDPIQLQCTASGNPAPNIQWNKVGDRFNPMHSFNYGVFRIENAQRSDEGEYECTVSNEAGSHTARAVVHVRNIVDPSISPRVSPSYYTGFTGESFTLTCEAGGAQHSIRWIKQHGQVSYNARDEQGILIVLNAEVSDSGVYTCIVSTDKGVAGTANATVQITQASTGVAPHVTVEPTQQTVSQGSTAEIYCEANGSPAPTVKWTRLTTGLPAQVASNTNKLVINNLQVHDRGVYVCVATNQLGMAQASSVLEVDPRESPVIEIHPSPVQTITAGGSALLHCRITAGIPNPRVTWHRPNGQPLDHHIQQLSDGVLRFTRITELEGGEYICTAENEAGKVTAVGKIIVQVPPISTINPPSPNITVPLGGFVRLECTATGTPTPSVEWNKYTPDHQSRKYDIQSLRTSHPAIYEITNVALEDQGTYICMTRNNAGAHESRIVLVVDPNPYPKRGDIPPEGEDDDNQQYPTVRHNERTRTPLIDVQTFTVPAGNRAELRCDIQNKGGETIYTNWIRADNRSLPTYSEIRQDTLYINNAQLSDAGEYHCLGISSRTREILFQVTAHLQVLSPPWITLNPITQVVRPGDNAVISCTATGQQPISIHWSGLNRTLPQSVYVQDGLLQFHGIQLSDTGKYRCTAQNSVGHADAVAEVKVEESMQQPPIQARDKEQSAAKGSTVTLSCSLRADQGNTEVYWTREYQQLPNNARTHGSDLTIYNIQLADAGKYYCRVSSGASDYINLYVTGSHTKQGSEKPTLHVQATNPSPRLGDTLDLYCRSSEPGVVTMWTKVSKRIADNVVVDGPSLRFNSLRRDNLGLYRCEARGYDGFYHKDYHVDVIDEDKNDDIAVQSAPEGSTVILDCKSDLDEPVNYLWTKQKGSLPRHVDVNAKSIQLTDVGSQDAGTYVCTSSNQYKTIETPTILLITGIVPYFTQAPNSYITLPSIPDPYQSFEVEVSFKPETSNGIIFYNGNENNNENADFVSLTLLNGIPEFTFSLGHQSTVTSIQGDRPLDMGRWHKIKVIRNRRRGQMYVDGQGPFSGISTSKFYSMTLKESLYIGGVPDANEISPHVPVRSGMVGCISRIKFGSNYVDLQKYALAKKGITSCETCSENPCLNRGVCQEALSPNGFMCICPEGYSGATCNKVGGESCTVSTCGVGRCVDTEDSYRCMCPLGKSGNNCEHEIEINEPAFSRNAFMAYPTPTQLRRMKINLKLKPRDLSDGIIAYCSGTEEGGDDFISLAVKDKRLEFRFDVGNGPLVIRSDHELKKDQWIVVSASKNQNEGRLLVNGDIPVMKISAGNHRALNLGTHFYIGGVDTEKITVNPGVEVTSGFNGCIDQVSVTSIDMRTLESVADSANIQDCKTLSSDYNNLDNDLYDTSYSQENRRYSVRETGCDSRPCRNDGQCYPLTPTTYKCSCINGFSGNECEIAPPLCDYLKPCQNQGTCHGNTTQYACDCLMGFTGTNCESPMQIRNDVHFSGNGYLEFSKTLLGHENDDEDEVIALELSTNSSDGLIFWHGQKPNEDGTNQDYISLAVAEGFLVYSFDLGSGAAHIFNNKVSVNDGMRHQVILKRRGSEGSIEVDNDFIETGSVVGLTSKMNCNGNIYLGGTPNIALMTGQRYTTGFNGCIQRFELSGSGQTSKSLDLGSTAISGLNVKACYRWIPSSLIFSDSDQFDEIIPPPPVNIIHPKPSSSRGPIQPSSSSSSMAVLILCACIILPRVHHGV